jgi:rhamnulokinase
MFPSDVTGGSPITGGHLDPDGAAHTPPESEAPTFVAAVDLGATSGRVMVAEVADGRVTLAQAHRFPTTTLTEQGRLRWDFTGLWREILEGLARAVRVAADAGGTIRAIGVDTWAVDYGLLDEDGQLIDAPICYRDDRTIEAVEPVWDLVGGRDRLHQVTGLQHQRFNTIFQLHDDQRTGRLDDATTMLLLPDLVSFRLTGRAAAEATNASTTGLFDATRREWSEEIIGALGLPRSLFPPVVEPGTVIGPILPAIAEATGLGDDVVVVAVGSHDTASAVAAVPTTTGEFAYISSGTWSLVGLELPAPVLTEASRRANFTNELGVDGTVRYLKNVMGLWLLTECQRAWEDEADDSGGSPAPPLSELLTLAADLPVDEALVDADDDAFLTHGQMPERIAAAVEASGGIVPRNPAAFTRCVIDSLAWAYERAIREAQNTTGAVVRQINIVGGGSRNSLLCQRTADVTGLPVVAGPAEASALGNALIAARAIGAPGCESVSALRSIVAASHPLNTYAPAREKARSPFSTERHS